MSLKFVIATVAIILINSTCISGNLGLDTSIFTLLRIFRHCWTEIGFVDSSEQNLNCSFPGDIPILISSASGRMQWSLFDTLQANQTLQLRFKCLALILYYSDSSQLPNSRLAVKFLHRYLHISHGAEHWINTVRPLWSQRLFKGQSSFVVRIENFPPAAKRIHSEFLEIEEECRCLIIVVRSVRGVWQLHLEKLLYLVPMTAILNLTSYSSTGNLMEALLPSIAEYFVNHTKLWNVDMFKDLEMGSPCITSAPPPSILLKSSERRFADQHFIYLLVNFLSVGRYSVSLALTSDQEFKMGVMGYNSGNDSCFPNTNTYLQWESNILFIRNLKIETIVGRLTSDQYAHARFPLSVTLLTSRHAENFNFITCDGRGPVNSNYTVYIRPFDLWLWLTLLCTFFSISLVSKWLILKFNLQDPVWLTIYALFLEASPHVTRKLQSKLAFSCVLAPTLYAVALLANYYKGILTADLTAALPWKGLETFHDAIRHNFSIYGDVFANTLFVYKRLCDEGNYERSLIQYVATVRGLNRSRTFRSKVSTFRERQNLLDGFQLQFKIPPITNLKSICTKLSNSYDYVYTGLKEPHPNDMILREITKCDKSVYAIPSENIFGRLLDVPPNTIGPTKIMYSGKAESMDLFKFGNQYYTLLLKEADYDQIYIKRNLESLSTGGFLHYWESLKIWYGERRYEEREGKFQEQMTQPMPLTLMTNCGTIFIILLSGIFLSITIAVIECIKNTANTIMNSIHYSQGTWSLGLVL